MIKRLGILFNVKLILNLFIYILGKYIAMDPASLDILEECLMVSNDVETLELYLAGKSILDDFYCDGLAITNVIKNVMPQHYTPLKKNITGTIVGQSLDEVNSRAIKYVVVVNASFSSRSESISEDEALLSSAQDESDSFSSRSESMSEDEDEAVLSSAQDENGSSFNEQSPPTKITVTVKAGTMCYRVDDDYCSIIHLFTQDQVHVDDV